MKDYHINIFKEIGNFKSFTARSMIDWLIQNPSKHILALLKAAKQAYKKDQKYQLWQEGFHPQVISNEEIL